MVPNVLTSIAVSEPDRPESITTDHVGTSFVLGADGTISAMSLSPISFDGTALSPGFYTPLVNQQFGSGFTPIQLAADPQGDLFVTTIGHSESQPPELWIIPYGTPGTMTTTPWVNDPVMAGMPALIVLSGTVLQHEFAPIGELGIEPSVNGGASALLLGYADGNLALLTIVNGDVSAQLVDVPTSLSTISAITFDPNVASFYVAANNGTTINLLRVGPSSFTIAVPVDGSFPPLDGTTYNPVALTTDPGTGAVVGTYQSNQESSAIPSQTGGSTLFAYLPSTEPQAVLLGSSLQPGTTTTLDTGVGSATGVVATPGTHDNSFTITDAYPAFVDGGYLRLVTTSLGATSASAPQITASEDPLSGAINAVVTPAPTGPQPSSYEVISETNVGGAPVVLGSQPALPCGAGLTYCASVNLGGISTPLTSATQVTLLAVPLYGALAGPIGIAPPLTLTAIPPSPSSATLTFVPSANGYAPQVVTFIESPESPIPYGFPSNFGVTGPFSLTPSVGTTSCGATLAAGQRYSVSVTPTGTPSSSSLAGSLIYGCTSSGCVNQPLEVLLEALGVNAGTLPSTGGSQSSPLSTPASPSTAPVGQGVLTSTAQASQTVASSPKGTTSGPLQLASAPPTNAQPPSPAPSHHQPRPTPTLSFVLSPAHGAPGTTVTLVDHTLPSGCTAPAVLFGRRVVARPQVVGGTFAPLSFPVPGDSATGATAITVSCGSGHLASLPFQVVTQTVHLNALDTSVLRPQHIRFTPTALAKSAIIALLVIPFVAFPSEILNNTLEEHEEELTAIRRRLRLGRKEGSTVDARWRNNLRLATALLIAGLLNGFLDPRFGLDLNSLVTFVGLLLGLTFVILASDLPVALFFKKNDPDAMLQGHVLPGAIVMAGACVLLSRLVHFEPGYLYGLVAGVQVINRVTISEQDQMRAQLRSFMTMLIVSVVAWFLRAPLDHLAGAAHVSVLVAGIDAALVSTFIGGLQGVLVGLLPLRFLPGRILYRMHRPAWIALFFVSAFLFIHLVLGRGSNYVGSIGGLAAAIALIGGFFLVTFLTWVSFVIYDRSKERREEAVGSRN
jgi:hypothetical protein